MSSQRFEPISAAEVLDCPPSRWRDRPWTLRRDAGPDDQPFCDIASSQILALLAARGALQPSAQRFVELPGNIQAWLGEFEWGHLWCASRGEHFWAWAQGQAADEARLEVAGPRSMWDADLAAAAAATLSPEA